MLVSELINQLNSEIVNFDEMDESSTDYTEKPIMYINRAIRDFSIALAKFKDTTTRTNFDIVLTGTPKPIDFLSFAPNDGYPVREEKGVFYPTINGTVKAFYYRKMPFVTDTSQVLPFDDFYSSILVQVTSLHILNRNEANIESDKTLVTETLSLLQSVFGGSNA